MAHISESTLEDVRIATFPKVSSGLSTAYLRGRVQSLLTSFALFFLSLVIL